MSYTFSDTRYASCFSSWSSFLPSSTSTLSLFLSRCVYVFVSSIIFHFSRSHPSLAASFATLSSPHATLPSLLTDYRDSSLLSFFHSIALLSAALPFPSLSPFPYSPFLFLFLSLLILYRCLPLMAVSSLSDSPLSFRSITHHTLSSFLFPCHNLSSLPLATSVSPFLTLPLTLFLPRSRTFFLFLPLFFFTLLHRSILVSCTLFSFINISFLFPTTNFSSLTPLYTNHPSS